MKKKRVLMVSGNSLGTGGVQMIMMGIIRKLHHEFHFDMLLFSAAKGYYEDEFLSYGGKIFRIPHYEGPHDFLKSIDGVVRDNHVYRHTLKILRQEFPYDIIHCHKEFESAPILKAAAKCNIPIRICHTHIKHCFSSYLKSFVNIRRRKVIENNATKLIGCSEIACSTIYSTRYSVINNFYDDRRYIYSPDKPQQGFVMTQVGAFSPNKNQLFSIKIAEVLRSKGLDVHLKLIGHNLQPEYRRQLEDYVSANSLSDMIEFLPGDSDIPSTLAASTCFIFPSLVEGFGISLIEAQAAGLYCFASDTVPETTDCGNVAYLSLNLGPVAWGSKIFEWYKETAGEKHQCNTAQFALSSVIESYRDLYHGK